MRRWRTSPARHPAFKDRSEGIWVDRDVQIERVSVLVRLGARFPVHGIVLDVVALPIEFADTLRRRGGLADGGDQRHARSHGRHENV